VADSQPRLYTDLAPWFHLLTAPEDYADDAAYYLDCLAEAAGRAPRTLLELGSGGGNMASHYKARVTATLTDLSPEMLAVSRTINPELEHVQGDMRSLRLGRTFDAVLVHDAVCYLTTEHDLRRAIETAWAHLGPGGVAVIAPDCVRETFRAGTEHGGHDGPDGPHRRALRYLMWTHDPDPADSTYAVDFAYLLREGDGPPRGMTERHVDGLFGQEDWLRLLAEVGFEARMLTRPYPEPDGPYETLVTFVAVKPEA
jgi:SAM-dependent methyltransferase